MKNTTKDKRNPINVYVGRNLSFFMECNNIPVSELANSFGIEKDSLKRILNGINGLSSEYCHILACEYHCNMNFLFSGMENTGKLSDIQTTTNTPEPEPEKGIAQSLRYLADVVEVKLKKS